MRAVVTRAAPRAISFAPRLRSSGTRVVTQQLRSSSAFRTSVILRAFQVAHVLSRSSSRDCFFAVRASATMSAPSTNPLLTDSELPLYDKVWQVSLRFGGGRGVTVISVVA